MKFLILPSNSLKPIYLEGRTSFSYLFKTHCYNEVQLATINLELRHSEVTLLLLFLTVVIKMAVVSHTLKSMKAQKHFPEALRGKYDISDTEKQNLNIHDSDLICFTV